MSRIVFDWPSVAGFIIHEARLDLSPSNVGTVGVASRDGKVLGGVLYHGYTGIGGSVTIHTAGNGRWVSKDLLWAVFDYAFGQLFVSKIFGPVASDNLPMIDIILRLGFVPEAVLKGVYPGADQLVFSMVRDQCRWLDYTPKTLQPNFGSLFRLLSPVGDM